MLNEKDRLALVKSLKESFLHRYVEDIPCAICGRLDLKLATHVIQYAQPQNKSLPTGFLPMSASGGTIRDCFPICEKCAPPYKKCGLPLPTRKVKDFLKTKRVELSGDIALYYGNGVCREFNLKLFIEAIIDKILNKSLALI